MRTFFRTLALAGVVVFAAGACDFVDEGLDVKNTNAPDQERALSEPGDVESLIGSGFRNWFYGFSRYYPAWALSVAGDEASSSWGNYGMRDISEEPRKAFNNSTTYGYRGVVQNPWYDMFEIISAENDGLASIAAGLEIGTDGADNQRAIAFAKFMQGMAHAYLALHYDRAYVFTEDMDLENTEFELQDYDLIMDAAIGMLEQAITEAGKSSFEIPDNWIPAGATMTNQDLIKVIHSYIARFMTAVARTPQERDAVNWNTVMSHIDAGITDDFGIMLDNTNWTDRFKNYTARYDWFRADYKTVGPADNSGGYQAWLAMAPGDRTDFDMDALDKRIQDGPTGSEGTEFSYHKSNNFRADRGTYHFSRYLTSKFYYIRKDRIGWDPILTRSEMDLLKAEALIRGGQNAAAADLINMTRVAKGGLPPADANGVSGANCIPKKLRDPAGGCADLWETMIYEKRVNEFVVAAGLAYWDARGWDLPRGSGKSFLLEGTPIHMPIPARELETLGMAFYTFGGVGGEGAAK